MDQRPIYGGNGIGSYYMGPPASTPPVTPGLPQGQPGQQYLQHGQTLHYVQPGTAPQFNPAQHLAQPSPAQHLLRSTQQILQPPPPVQFLQPTPVQQVPQLPQPTQFLQPHQAQQLVLITQPQHLVPPPRQFLQPALSQHVVQPTPARHFQQPTSAQPRAPRDHPQQQQPNPPQGQLRQPQHPLQVRPQGQQQQEAQQQVQPQQAPPEEPQQLRQDAQQLQPQHQMPPLEQAQQQPPQQPPQEQQPPEQQHPTGHPLITDTPVVGAQSWEVEYGLGPYAGITLPEEYKTAEAQQDLMGISWITFGQDTFSRPVLVYGNRPAIFGLWNPVDKIWAGLPNVVFQPPAVVKYVIPLNTDSNHRFFLPAIPYEDFVSNVTPYRAELYYPNYTPPQPPNPQPPL